MPFGCLIFVDVLKPCSSHGLVLEMFWIKLVFLALQEVMCVSEYATMIHICILIAHAGRCEVF